MPMPMPNAQPKRIIDLRKHQRTITPSSALFSFKQLVIPVPLLDDVEGEGAILDLSLGGCRLLSETPLTLGQEYHLILQILVEQPPIPVEAAVSLHRLPEQGGTAIYVACAGRVLGVQRVGLSVRQTP